MHKNIGQRSRKGRSPRSGSVSIDKCPAVVEAAAQTFSLTAGVLHFYVADITYSQLAFKTYDGLDFRKNAPCRNQGIYQSVDLPYGFLNGRLFFVFPDLCQTFFQFLLFVFGEIFFQSSDPEDLRKQ